MANTPIKLKIDVMKIDKEQLYPGKNGAKYLTLVLWVNKDGVGPYGDTHYVTQDISKEARAAGGRGAIVGNATVPVAEGAPAGTAPYQPKPKSPDTQAPKDSDDVPF